MSEPSAGGAVGGAVCGAVGESCEKADAATVFAGLSIQEGGGLYKSPMSVEEKVRVAMSVGEEVVSPEELEKLFASREHPIVYDGFEPSGRMHIAQGVLRYDIFHTSLQ